MVAGSAREAFELAAAEAAHETAGPLHAVGAALGLLRSSIAPDDDDARLAVELAERHLRLAQLQLGRFARLASGPDEPAAERLDLTALARQLTDDLSTTLLAVHEVQVEASGPVEVVADADQVRGLLFNLLSNAAKYSPPGRCIVVGIRQGDDRVELRVRDQGHGVATDDAERLFERYERGEIEVRGLGLGLPLARDIARAHGGDLTLEPAEDDGGSTFLLSLPEAGPR